MRKFFSILAGAAAVAALAVSCSKDRSEVLKVYNWSDYIAEDVIEEFEAWYEEQTGEPIHVIYQTFDVNEAMLSKIEMGHEDFDVVCASDYIIERMLNNDLIVPLDFASIPEELNYIKSTKSPFIEQMSHDIHPTIDANDYAVAYMWGTTGIIYNSDKVTEEEASTWDIIRNPKFFGKILIKDAPRDVYSPVLIYLKQKELQEGSVTLQELMWDSSDESLKAVSDYLKECAPGVYGWEADFGKDQMTKDRAYVSLNWSGDAVWAIEEAADVGVNLAYTVPKEGSNVWFDGWVIPKYAKNVKAATWFIDFMNRPDIAIRNMEETGYVAANGAFEVLESQIDEESYDPIDVSYFFGEEAAEVCVDPALYPDRSTIENCALEHDWGADTEKLLSMWQDVKSSGQRSFASGEGEVSWAVVGIFVLITGLAVWSTVKRTQKKRRLQYSRRVYKRGK